MEHQKESITTWIGAVADIVAIVTVILSGITFSAFILLALLTALFCIILYLFFRYRERCTFLQFVEHLLENHTHKFTLLPKVCMALDSSGERKNLHITKMNVKHVFDFSGIETASISPDEKIDYLASSEYLLTVENKHIPEEFSCYLGDMYSDPSFSIYQKHGYKTVYETVPAPDAKHSMVSSAVTKYSWQLKDYTAGSRTFPICFKLNQLGHTKIHSKKFIVFYPKQYGRRIDDVDFEISCICKENILKKVELHKIWKDKTGYKHTPISDITLSHNKATAKIAPDAKKYEAYYFSVYFER